MAKLIPPNISHPGALVREEVEGRGWSLSDLAKIMGRPLQTVSEIVNGKKSITAATAHEIGEAFGTGPEFWINLQSMWELSQASTPAGEVRERAALYEMAPIREMVRRNWIKKTGNPEELAAELARHYGVESLDQVPEFIAATRASVSGENSTLTPEQWAWCCRGHRVSSLVDASKYRADALREAIGELRLLTTDPEEIRKVPHLLADAGVRLVIVEHLQHTRLDGAALRRGSKQPVVALSLRYGHIDKFWHNLLHEVAHILNQDGISADSDLHCEGDVVDAVEARANRMAAEWLVPKDEMDYFIRRTSMAYTWRKIENFSGRMRVHPAIVAGQLKFRGELGWKQFSRFHIDVRSVVRQSNISDGWDEPAPLGE